MIQGIDPNNTLDTGLRRYDESKKPLGFSLVPLTFSLVPAFHDYLVPAFGQLNKE
ncbi:MAG TPA: hypothetical protein VHO84_02140 [Syntrophorhabdaceae bacterium]|nr:hypothetical protein [Syntrophorhabdaceae bacterium]